MVLTADYHTHTTYSHGKNSVLENALVAKEKGLLELGISDHGFSHPAFGLTERKLPKLSKDIALAKQQTGVNVLLGIESNIIGTDGTVDLKSYLYDDFDVFLAGIHKFVLYKFGTWFSLAFPNLFSSWFNRKNIPERLKKENTKTFINVIKNNPVDIITHINFCCFADAKEVAKVARDYGTYIELNAKKVHLTDQELYDIASTGVKFVIDSDAHSKERVGEISLVKNLLSRVQINREQIANIDGRLPEFRFKKFKERA